MDKGKLLTLIGLALTVVSVAISAISLVMVMSVVKNMKAEEVPAETAVDGVLPLSKTTNYKLTEAVIATLYSSTDSDEVMNTSIEIGFRFNNEDADATTPVIDLLTANEGVIRDRITKLLKTKTIEDIETPGSDVVLQQEILALASLELETDLIVEVYFEDFLQSKR